MMKKRILMVVADDLTGAAEIAGIAIRYGLRTTLVMKPSATAIDEDIDVLVVATDMRSMSEQEAVAVLSSMLHPVASRIHDGSLQLFKKTDSALRGHIMAETDAMLKSLGLHTAVLIPQNPSKGRIIDQGRYYIDGTPLHETSFAYDPEFPATSSSTDTLLKGSRRLGVGDDMTEQSYGNTIYIADATNEDDISRQLEKCGTDSLIGGGADCFDAFLKASGHKPCAQQPIHGHLPQDDLLVVCGSTQNMPTGLTATDISMPDDVFHGSSPEEWITRLVDEYNKDRRLVIRVGNHRNAGLRYAVRLKQTMAVATCHIVEHCRPKTIVIEGGATAFAILSRLQWTNLTVEKELASGIVSLIHADNHHSTSLILKPGSYPWK